MIGCAARRSFQPRRTTSRAALTAATCGRPPTAAAGAITGAPGGRCAAGGHLRITSAHPPWRTAGSCPASTLVVHSLWTTAERRMERGARNQPAPLPTASRHYRPSPSPHAAAVTMPGPSPDATASDVDAHGIRPCWSASRGTEVQLPPGSPGRPGAKFGDVGHTGDPKGSQRHEVVPGLVELEVAVPRLSPAVR